MVPNTIQDFWNLRFDPFNSEDFLGVSNSPHSNVKIQNRQHLKNLRLIANFDKKDLGQGNTKKLT